MDPGADAGTGTLQGQVMQLTDSSFTRGSLFKQGATVTADGANGSPVMGIWKGVDPFDPFELEGVARVTTNWVSVEPDLSGDALPTWQALQTYQVTSANLAVVSATILDSIFNAASTLRSANSGQVVVFFRSAAAGTPVAGLHATMTNAQAGLYASVATGWTLDDGNAVTDASGLVLFANVAPAATGATQLITVTRAATASMGAAPVGQFPVKVAAGAVSIIALGIQL